MSSEEPVLIRIEVTGRNRVSREELWAKYLGNDLYQLKAPSSMIAEFHFGDVVRAVTSPPNNMPLVLEVVQRSGHKTIRIVFLREVNDLTQQKILNGLQSFQVTCRMAFDRFWTVDIDPRENYQVVYDYLRSAERAGCLIYKPNVDISTLVNAYL